MYSIYDQFRGNVLRANFQLHVGVEKKAEPEPAVKDDSEPCTKPQEEATVPTAPEEVTEPSVEDVTDTVQDDTVVALADAPSEETPDVSKMKKSELIDLVKKDFGEDADVSGTKQDIIDRFFKD